MDNLGCHPYSDWQFDSWLSRPCSTRVQIQKDGRISVLHDGVTIDNFDLAQDGLYGSRTYKPEAIKDVNLPGGRSIFDVVWSTNQFPEAAASCAPGCTVDGTTCLCDVAVEVSAVFTDAAHVPAPDEIQNLLHIGGMDPAAYDLGTYTQCTTVLCQSAASDVEVWMRVPVSEPVAQYQLDESTIFKVTESGRFYMNKESRVSVQGGYSFRNPPSFMDPRHPTEQQAQLETAEVISHLVHHPSTAPFLCKKLIQRLTMSNPSPRYTQAVVTAFRTGVHNGQSYSGKYGDLAAATAAIFLDREARDSTLDLDPAVGKIREPLLKVIHLMRRSPEVEFSETGSKIGMSPFGSPSVFNFYLPDHMPAQGPIGKAMLFAPEAQIMTVRIQYEHAFVFVTTGLSFLTCMRCRVLSLLDL
jgi:hypothetical protein